MQDDTSYRGLQHNGVSVQNKSFRFATMWTQFSIPICKMFWYKMYVKQKDTYIAYHVYGLKTKARECIFFHRQFQYRKFSARLILNSKIFVS